MRTLSAFVLALAMTSTASADLQSTIGGKPLTERMVHNTGVGWPSVFYEWWNDGRGRLDWALGAGLVYGDWAGAFSDIDIGLALQAPLRFHLKTGARPRTTIDTAFRFTPAILIGNCCGPGDLFVFGIRGELAVPVSIKVHERVNVVTGGTIPLSLFIVEDPGDNFGVIPILIRMGVEVEASPKVAPWFLLEIGPGIGISDGDTDVDFAFRIWVGTSFWSILK